MFYTVKVAVCATVLLSVPVSLLAEDQIELPTSTDRSSNASLVSEKHKRLLNLFKVTKMITDQGRPNSSDFGKWNYKYAKNKMEELPNYNIDWPNFEENRKKFEEAESKIKEYEELIKIDLKDFTMA